MLSAELILQNKDFRGFLQFLRENTIASGREYSYLGVNFRGSEISSIKLYYTFFGVASLGETFPIPQLALRFSEYKGIMSKYHVDSPHAPGCGITFTIKFEKDGGLSRGVYFRVQSDPRRCIEKFLSRIGLPMEAYHSHFDGSGMLKYLSVEADGALKERNYIYCPRCRFLDAFDRQSGIRFSAADCLEISTDWDECAAVDNMKFIAISPFSLIDDNSLLETEAIVRRCEESGLVVSPWFALHGYYLYRNVKSVFLFSREKGGNSVLPPSMRVGRGAQ